MSALPWVFSVVILFQGTDGKPPIFGDAVRATVASESEETCRRIRSMILKEIRNMRHEPPTECKIEVGE